MNLTLNQFDILVEIESNQNIKYTQRYLADKFYLSVGIVNKTIQELIEQELIIVEDNSKYKVTIKGYEWLEPHKVKKAIFLAAGFGSRMVPITLNTPKPLIKVNGKRIIETLLEAVVNIGIKDITIVRGYLGEQFDILLKDYPNIKFIDNNMYNEANNISSAYLIKDMLSNAYVLESDLILYNKSIIRKYEYSTNYIGRPCSITDDWCFEVKKNIITKVKVGGKDVHHMYGVSYWNKEDAKKMSIDIEDVYKQPGGKEKYWDEVSLTYCKDHYNILVRQVHEEDIIEIDTYEELKAVDASYKQ
ncbi:MAG: sugar phosphate nucleotidyltransferase [Erysipelotrichaceae bacterium]